MPRYDPAEKFVRNVTKSQIYELDRTTTCSYLSELNERTKRVFGENSKEANHLERIIKRIKC